MYDPRDEQAIIRKTKKKHGLLSVKELEDEYKQSNKGKFEDYTRKRDDGKNAKAADDGEKHSSIDKKSET